ncbi:MAG: imelysin family protein [Myxococcota bacterium]
MKTYPLIVLFFAIAACGDDPTDITARDGATLDVKDYVTRELVALRAAAESLQASTPATSWTHASHATAVEDMRAAWKQARIAYEHVEGAIAVLFEDLDYSTDARYEMFLEEGADTDLFDDQIVIGMHAIERILWADAHPQWVTDFESTLPGYHLPSYPNSEPAAQSFKAELAQKLVDDFDTMHSAFAPLALDAADAYRGVLGSMAEQFEKVNLAATGEDESRYAQHTLADMRANLAGGREIYAAFRDWLRGEPGGADVDATIVARFDAIQEYYDDLVGESLPEVPGDWNPDAPDDSTAYGRLFVFLSAESDVENPESLVAAMRQGATILGITVLD